MNLKSETCRLMTPASFWASDSSSGHQEGLSELWTPLSSLESPQALPELSWEGAVQETSKFVTH